MAFQILLLQIKVYFLFQNFDHLYIISLALNKSFLSPIIFKIIAKQKYKIV